MAPVGSYGRASAQGAGRTRVGRIDEGRLDPKLERLTTCAAPPAIPSYLVVGLPICFMVALGIILIGFHGALTLPAIGLLAFGGLGLICVRYLNRHW